MAFCSKCGNEIIEGVKYCNMCGGLVSDSIEKSDNNKREDTNAHSNKIVNNISFISKIKSKLFSIKENKKHRKLIKIIAAVIVILITMTASYYMFFHQEPIVGYWKLEYSSDIPFSEHGKRMYVNDKSEAYLKEMYVLAIYKNETVKFFSQTYNMEFRWKKRKLGNSQISTYDLIPPDIGDETVIMNVNKKGEMELSLPDEDEYLHYSRISKKEAESAVPFNR